MQCMYVILVFPDIDECHSNPCAHKGTCIDAVNSLTCSCVEGYTGHDCETGTTKPSFIRMLTIHYTNICQYSLSTDRWLCIKAPLIICMTTASITAYWRQCFIINGKEATPELSLY